MSSLCDCANCHMTCCPNSDPYRLPEDFGKQKAREALEKIRKDFVEEIKETEKEESIKLNNIKDLFDEKDICKGDLKMIVKITEYCQDVLSELDFGKDLKVKVYQNPNEYLISFRGMCKFSLMFLNDLDEFLNNFDLYIDNIYNKSQLTLDENYLYKIEVETVVVIKGNI